MYTSQPKKLLILNILDILKRHTDADHRLSQKDIIDILKNQYAMSADRKAVKRNLMNLVDYGYPIEYSVIERIGKSGEDESIYTDWYIEHDFSDAELRLLIDSLLFSGHIPTGQCQSLIGKLQGLSNSYFKANVKHIRNLPENRPTNSELFLTIEVLDEAISKHRQVSFIYNDYGLDLQLYPRQNSDGNTREYIINPYQMVATNGKYYLICNYDKYDNVANYRLDRITKIKLLDTPAKAMKKVRGLENGLDLPRHMAEHIYMFSGESVQVSFRAGRYLVTEIIDWFGKDVVFSDLTEEEVTVTVQVNEEAMRLWAMQYALHVRVIEPERLVRRVIKDLMVSIEKYQLLREK